MLLTTEMILLRERARTFLLRTFPLCLFFFCSCEKYSCPPSQELVADTMILPVRQNALIDHFYPNNNFSTSPTLLAGAAGPGIEQQSLLDFDYSLLPANATIVHAYLNLYADTNNLYSFYFAPGHFVSDGTNAWKLKRILANWQQSTVTWNTRPANDSIHQLLLSASTSAWEKYRVDVTTLATDQFKAPATYHGFSMSIQDTLAYACVSFCSSAHSYTQLAPTLEVVYLHPKQ